MTRIVYVFIVGLTLLIAGMVAEQYSPSVSVICGVANMPATCAGQ